MLALARTALLARLPALAGGAGAGWRAARDLRRPPGAQGGDRHSLRRRLLATLPHPLHDQLPEPGAEAGAASAGADGAHHLPAALAAGGARPAPARGGTARRALPTGCGAPG